MEKSVLRAGIRLKPNFPTFVSGFRYAMLVKQKKMTQSELAGKIGKERSFISKVEREGSNLTLSTLYDIVTKGLGGKLNIEVQF